MKALIVTHHLGRGGTEKAAVTTAIALHRKGVQVRVLCTESLSGPRLGELVNAGITAERLTPSFLTSRAPDLAGWNPDLVNFHILREDFAFVGELRAMLPHALFVETNIFSDTKPYCRHYDVSLQLSEWCLLNYYLRQPRLQKLPSVVVPNPVPSEGFFRDPLLGMRLRLRLGIPAGARVLGRVGQNNDAKWDPQLITVFEALSQEFSQLWLVLVGISPSIEERLLGLPGPLRSRVLVLPYLDTTEELRAFYSSLDVFLHLSSIGESFGYVLAEALLCEVPVVTLSTPDADNTQVLMVQHRKSGLVATGILDAIRHTRLLLSTPVGRSLGRHGRKQVLEHDSPETVAQSLIQLANGSLPLRSLQKRAPLGRVFSTVLCNPGPRPYHQWFWCLRVWARLRYPRLSGPLRTLEFFEKGTDYIVIRAERLLRRLARAWTDLFCLRVRAVRGPLADSRVRELALYPPATVSIPEWRPHPLTEGIQSPKRVEQVPPSAVWEIRRGCFRSGEESVFAARRKVFLGLTSQVIHPWVGRPWTKPLSRISLSGRVAHLSLSGLESNYYHFVVEFLARWYLLSLSRVAIDYYAVADDCSFQDQWYTKLGIRQDQILRLPRNSLVVADVLIVPSLINNSREIKIGEHTSYYKRYLPGWFPEVHAFWRGTALHGKGKRIYISRSRASSRRVLNEHEVRRTLEGRGFESFDLEALRVDEQVELFRQASWVIGVHGAGLANLVFCPPDAAVLELYSHRYWDPGMRLIAASVGLTYGSLIAEASSDPGEIPPQKEDLFVNMTDLHEAIEQTFGRGF